MKIIVIGLHTCKTSSYIDYISENMNKKDELQLIEHNNGDYILEFEKDINGAIIMFDKSDRKSFDFAMIQYCCIHHFSTVLVGYDCKFGSMIDMDEVNRFCKIHRAQYYNISVKTSYNNMFKPITYLLEK